MLQMEQTPGALRLMGVANRPRQPRYQDRYIDQHFASRLADVLS
jgi:hypothetical protein